MRRSVQGMLEELEYNLWEHILCRLVDYGHTFSPEVCIHGSVCPAASVGGDNCVLLLMAARHP
jgi:hypothetical protein